MRSVFPSSYQMSRLNRVAFFCDPCSSSENTPIQPFVLKNLLVTNVLHFNLNIVTFFNSLGYLSVSESYCIVLRSSF